jgi:hypothetical protein
MCRYSYICKHSAVAAFEHSTGNNKVDSPKKKNPILFYPARVVISRLEDAGGRFHPLLRLRAPLPVHGKPLSPPRQRPLGHRLPDLLRLAPALPHHRQQDGAWALLRLLQLLFQRWREQVTALEREATTG